MNRVIYEDFAEMRNRALAAEKTVRDQSKLLEERKVTIVALNAELNELKHERDGLREVVEELHKDADGKHVIPGHSMWCIDKEDDEAKPYVRCVGRALNNGWTQWGPRVSKCYSSKDAAEAVLADRESKPVSTGMKLKTGKSSPGSAYDISGYDQQEDA